MGRTKRHRKGGVYYTRGVYLRGRGGRGGERQVDYLRYLNVPQHWLYFRRWAFSFWSWPQTCFVVIYHHSGWEYYWLWFYLEVITAMSLQSYINKQTNKQTKNPQKDTGDFKHCFPCFWLTMNYFWSSKFCSRVSYIYTLLYFIPWQSFWEIHFQRHVQENIKNKRQKCSLIFH